MPHSLRWAAALGLTLALGTACGSSSPAAAPDTAASSSAPADDAQPASGDGVPNACDVVADSEAAAALEADLAGGEESRVVSSRSVCMYDDGTVIGVSEGSQFAATISAGEGSGITYETLSDVGSDARFGVVYDSVGSLVAVDGDYMVDLTYAIGDDRQAAKERMAAAARALFDALA